ncbi:MAG: pyridoxamine 5'-phosphate oxidase family protein [Alphaproteobacteria bacterium]|nr:pyridoxamine 5'-phosphate oxidase family protein [Alphaproteobacteria bacterium]
MDDLSQIHTITSESALRALYPPVSQLARIKELDHLDRYARTFIAASPFACLGTARADGAADVSPRGDAPGFVKVVDERTLALPDRPGNNRLDSLANIVANPNVGLMFLIPGIAEILRVNGQARITRDPALLASFVVNGKLPTAAIVIAVRQVFLHCSKAIHRGRLWDDGAKVDRKLLPPLGHMIVEQTKAAIDPEQAEAMVQESLRTRLY